MVKFEIKIMLISVCFVIALGSYFSVRTIAIMERQAIEQKNLLDENFRTINRLNRDVKILSARLAPKSYHLPVENMNITSPMGYRTDPLGGSRYERLHKGVDISAEVGTPVYAVLSGYVKERWLSKHPVFGRMVVISHGKGLYSIYGHLQNSFVSEGDFVFQGETIGTVGNSGLSTAAHLHFEVVVDPLMYLEHR